MNRAYKSIYWSITFLILTVLVGVFGFYIIEDYSILEAFYMTIITMSTVGYGEVRELSEVGMVFTSIIIIVSFGLFAYVATSLTKSIFDGGFLYYFINYRTSKRIKKMKRHTIICGFGRNGKQAAIELLNHGEAFVIIEKDPKVIEEIRDKGYTYIQGNATNDAVLEEAGIHKAKALVTTMPADADNLFVVLSAREMKAQQIKMEKKKKEINENEIAEINKFTIISRASEDHSDKKLKLAGADNVIMPDKIGGKRMAKLVVQPDIVEFIDYLMLQSAKDVTIAEISCKNLANCFVNKSIRELDIKSISGAYIIGIKTSNNDYIVNPPGAFILSKTDKLFVLGTMSQIIQLKEVLFSGR